MARLGHDYFKDCAVCNCWHEKPLNFQGRWHTWQKPSKALVDLRKAQKRSRRKSPF